MRSVLLASASLALINTAYADPTLDGVSSGIYQVDKTHAFLTWSVRHNGISDYIVNFTDFDATLDFDAQDPTKSALEVTINPLGLETKYPNPEKKAEWENELATDARFFNAGTHPTISFVATDIALTDEFSGTVTGDLTFLGITKPVTLEVSYGGVANVPWYGQRDLIGFTATATLNRSDFGLTAVMGAASDEVQIEFSGEFLETE